MDFYAHSLPQKPRELWQPLDRHLIEVGRVAGEFASAFGAKEWGNLAGLWHDLGKYSAEFQAYLSRDNGYDAHIENAHGRVDHSTAGAQHAVAQTALLGHLLAYIIAGHHSGLLDSRSEYACQEDRLKKRVHAWRGAPPEIMNSDHLSAPTFLARTLGKKDAFAVSFFVRMVFSCLADADFLDTEMFMDPGQATLRGCLPEDTLDRMEKALDEYIHNLAAGDSIVNKARAEVRKACLASASSPPGFFSLTVPTGGGKTLASLAFALRHAKTRGLRRIIYVLPFTTIIEQNANEYRKVMSTLQGIPVSRLIIEHHSNFDAEKETAYSRLACENWDAPLIVTTSVQFYESLFGNRTSACRKLHNLARAVIILDEAQTIPVEYIQPSLRALSELVKNYGSTVVLCTATQPAIHKRNDFPIGIENVREIIPDPPELYRQLKRVAVENLGLQNDSDLILRFRNENQVLCVVNTRGHARLLAEALGSGEGNFHLSALMCPAHRALTLERIRRRLAEGNSCRVISTRLIEAGVDIDFPVVYRSMAGLDSIAQAAGRCNRNGQLQALGKMYIFRSEHQAGERFIADTVNCAAQVLERDGKDPLDLDTIERYFKLYYWDQTGRWDPNGVLSRFRLAQDSIFPFLFDFATAAADFQIIGKITKPVIIPWGAAGMELCSKLRILPGMNREIARQMQSYTVQIYERSWMKQLERTIEPIFENSMGILISPQMNYSDIFGLHLDDPSGDALVI